MNTTKDYSAVWDWLMESSDNKALGHSHDEHGHSVYLFVKNSADTVLRVSACEDYQNAMNGKGILRFMFDAYCFDCGIEFVDECSIVKDWHCPNCGFLDPREVTFEETCSHCGTKLK